MANDGSRDNSGGSSPDAAASDANSSIQVHFDTCSNRGRSTGTPSRPPSARPSPSRLSETSLARQATANSLVSFLSSRPSSQTSQTDQPAAEDLLRDLIATTESSTNALTDALHGMKRPHDGDAAGEPSAKRRDKLSEELERMAASNPVVHASVTVGSTVPSTSSALAGSGYPPTASNTSPSESTATQGSRDTLPIRPARRRWPQSSNGVETSRRGSSVPSDQGNSSSSDESGELTAEVERQ